MLVRSGLKALLCALALMTCAAATAVADTSYAPAGSFATTVGSGDGEVSSPQGVAVEASTGNVFVVDRDNNRVQVFAPDGSNSATYLAQFGAGVVDQPSAIALDQTNGDVYVSDADDIVKFTSDGAAVPTFTQDVTFTSPGISGPLAFDQTANELFVADKAAGRVRRYDADGTAGASYDGAASGAPFRALLGVAVQDDGDVIVLDGQGFVGGVYQYENRLLRFRSDDTFAASLPAPPAKLSVVATVPGTDDILFGQEAGYTNLNPSYIIAPSARLWRYTGDSLGGTTILPVETQAIGGLAVSPATGNQLYVPTGPAYTAPTSVQVFTPFSVQAPAVTNPAAVPTETGARLRGTLNPERDGTRYHFEYGSTTSYGKRFPLTDANLPAGADPVAVAVMIGGLEPNTSYHFRLVASNGGGTTYGDDVAFTTTSLGAPGETGGSSGRAFEQVSPVDKAGGAVSKALTMQVASTGAAIAFGSGSALPSSESSSTQGYLLARRSASGWTTDAIDPPTLADGQAFLGAQPTMFLTPDLGAALQYSAHALVPGATEAGNNLYRRDNLTRSRTLMMTYGRARDLAANIGSFGSIRRPTASADGSHFLFQTSDPILPEAAPGVYNLYESVNGQLRIVNRTPDGAVDARGGIFGNTTVPDPHQISEDGRRIYFQAQVAGPLYLREDGERTRAVSVSHLPGGSPDAVGVYFDGASADGRFAYFNSTAELTPDATPGNSQYRFDASDGSLTRLPISGDVGFGVKVINISDDGNRVYFTDGSVLKVWEGDQVTQIAQLTSNEQGIELRRSTSASGRYLMFESSGQPTGFDNSQPSGACKRYYGQGGAGGLGTLIVDCREVFLYDAVADTLKCLSCSTSSDNRASLVLFGTAGTISDHAVRQVLDDGRAFFTSAEGLVSADVNGRQDVYEWHDGSVRLITTGRSPEDATLTEVSPDGRDVYFATAERLVAQDVDNSTDLYDARVGGGIAAQNTPPPPDAPECEQDLCQGTSSPASTPRTPGTDQAKRDGNAPPASRRGFSVKALSAAQRSKLAQGTPVSLRVRTTAAGRVTVTVRGKVGRTVRTLASQTRAATKAQEVSLSLRLSAAARKELARTGTLRVSLSVRMDGVRLAQTRALVLRLPPAKARQWARSARARVTAGLRVGTAVPAAGTRSER